MRAIGEAMRWVLRSGLRWALLAFLIVAFLWFVPQLQVVNFSPKVPAEDRPALVNEYRRTWAQVIGGFGLLLGLYFTWRRVEIAQDQQVTERFTRAIDQLGATDETTGKPRLEIRLGGIYALERIARDSPKRDYSTVMEVLTAYVRENTTQAAGPPKGFSDVATKRHHTLEQPPPTGHPTADIQAILDVLRRAQNCVPDEYRIPLDLHEANLLGADLQRADLVDANLQKANLQSADLSGTQLEGATLSGADLRWADLVGADLQRAKLTGADLQRATLYEANLRRARLRAAALLGADLQGADLTECLLPHAEVTDAQLAKAQSLQGATMPDGSEHP